MGKINGIFFLRRILKHFFANCCSPFFRKDRPLDPPSSMLWSLRKRPIYFSQFTHPHILKFTAPALSWGCGGCGKIGNSNHEHTNLVNTETRSVPFIFPIDGLLFCVLRFARRTEHCAAYFAQAWWLDPACKHQGDPHKKREVYLVTFRCQWVKSDGDVGAFACVRCSPQYQCVPGLR